MATEAISEGNKLHDDQLRNSICSREEPLNRKDCCGDHPEVDDDGCGRDYYDSEGVPIHVLDSGEEIKLPRVPQHYYGVKNGKHCCVPVCEEMEETIEDLPPGVHRGPPGYLKEVWEYARKAAYQARTKASDAALANMYERELKLQVYFLNRSIEAWKLKAIHLMNCTSCFGNAPATPSLHLPNPPPSSTSPPAAVSELNPPPSSTVPPAAAISEVHDPILDIIMQAKPSTAITSTDPLAGVSPTTSSSALPSASVGYKPPVMNGAMATSSYHPIPTTSDAIVTATVSSSLHQRSSPQFGDRAKPAEVKRPTPTKTYKRKGVVGKRKSGGSGGVFGSLAAEWKIPRKRRTAF